MFSAHSQIRDALALILQLRTGGYRNMRFMLLSGSSTQTIFIGPRKLFAIDDGLYIPTDLRHRAVRLNLGEPMPHEAEMIGQVSSTLSAGMNDATDLGLDREDEPYRAWLVSLTQFLRRYEMALPRREMHEFLNKDCQELKIEFRNTVHDLSLAPAIRFHAPPGGVLTANPDHSISEPSIAQPRPCGAPNLLWNIDRGLTEFEKEYLS